MYVIEQSGGDPMLVGTSHGLLALGKSLRSFLESGDEVLELRPGEAIHVHEGLSLLNGLRIRKTQAISLRVMPDRWLEVSGSISDLRLLAEKLASVGSGGHWHWYASPLSLIVEAEDDLDVLRANPSLERP